MHCRLSAARSALRYLCLLLALSVGSVPVGATAIPFGPQQIVSDITLGARSVVAGDVDGDGDMDLVTASSTDNAIGWHDNDGEGNFSIGELLSNSFTGARSVALGDLDGDGDLDAVAAARTLATIAWFENDGQGDFAPEVPLETGFSGVRSVALGDADGDGDLDVFGGGDSSSLVAWYENDGSGGFGPAQTVTTAALFVQEIYLSDVDGDGDIDVLSASAIDNKIAWYANIDGLGSFGPQQVLATDALDARSVTAADIDGDGDQDIIATSQDDDTVFWFENVGGGSFGPKSEISSTVDEPQTVFAVDLDGDGDVDVLTILQSGNAVLWFENSDGEGSFLAGQTVTDEIDRGESLTVADLDADGDLDVVSASTNDSRIAWYENGTLRSSAVFPPPILVDGDALGVERVRIGDLDGDGDEDLVAALDGTSEIVWYENDASGTFAAPQVVAPGFIGARDLNLADLDTDGDLDVVASAGSSDRVSWYENLGDATFGPENPIDLDSDGAEEVDFGDFDADGDLDLLVASKDDDTVAWFENLDGAGTFGSRTVITGVALGARSIEAPDLDGDGDTDVLYAAADANLVGWHANVGGGSFAPLETIDSSSVGPFAIDAGDIDGDGDVDVAAVANLAGEVSWYQNGGNGVWERRLIDSSFLNPADIRAIDVDRDGDLDFIIAAAGSSTIAWFENLTGIGTFGPPTVLSSQADGAESIAGADLDSDGDIDIAAGAMADGVVRWFSNCGGQFALATMDSAPARLLQSGRDDVLTIGVTHNGASGDPPLAVERIRLFFEETPGVPLNEVQATDLFQSLSIFRDDGSGLFERQNDVSVVLETDIGLINGETSLELPDGILNEVSVDEPATFFIVVELNPDAAEKDPASFLVTHVVEGPESTLATYLEGIPARAECPEHVSSSQVLTGSLQLSLSGPCPGMTNVMVSGGNANDSVAIAWATGAGSAQVPVGECSGSELNLDSPSLFRFADFDGNGSLTLQFNAPGGVCGLFLQALDLQNCARSNVDIVGFHAPVAEDGTVTTDEDVVADITLVATDIDEDELTYTIIDPPVNGQLSGTGPEVSYLADENFFGADSFTFVASDGELDSEIATVTITIDPVNDPPVAFDASFDTPEDTPLAVTLTASDVEDDPLTFELVDMPANGTVSGDVPDVTYTPNNGFFGADTFTFRASDGDLESNLATISIGVTQVNSAPIAVDGVATTDEDLATVVTLMASDPDLDPLEYTIVDAPASGVVTGTPPDVTYTPDDDFNGADSFTFQVSDGLLDSNLATISLTVNPVNDPPVAQDQVVATDEDVDLPVLLAATDVDLDPLTYTVVDSPSGGTLSGTPPDVTYSPDENFNGADSFTFVANDGEVDSNLATVTIAVAAINDPPVAQDQEVTTEPDVALDITLVAIDPEDDPLQYQLVSGPANGSVAGPTPQVLYTPDAGFTGSDSFVFRSFDGDLISNEATVTINVVASNAPPVADDQLVATDEDVALAVTLTANDPDLDALTFTVVDPPLNGELTGTAPDLVYTPDGDFNGSDSFTFRANDGEFDSNLATVSITVNAVNDPPVADDQAVETTRNDALAIVLTGSDPEDDPLIFMLIDPPTNGEVDGIAPNVTYTPDPGYVGPDSFTFIANDGDLQSEIATVTITVTQGNVAPTADDLELVTDEDVALSIVLTGDDPDLDPLTYAVVDSPTNGELTGVAPDLSYTPDLDFHGVDTFTFTTNDGEFTSPVATVTITVNPVNDPPVADDQNLVTDEDLDLVLVLSGSDVDLDALTFTIVDPPVSGGLVGTTPDLTYVPDPDANGVDTFTFVANDGTLDSEVATITITVSALNDPPVADPQSVAGPVNTDLLIALSGQDIDGDTLTFSIDTLPTSGTLSGVTQIPPAGAEVTYTPALDFVGTDSFVVLVDDGAGGTDTAAIDVEIVP